MKNNFLITNSQSFMHFQLTGITATQIPQSPALLHDELNMLNSQATPIKYK